MESSEDVLHKIQALADRSTELEQERSKIPVSPATHQEYERRLDETVNSLQNQVNEHQAALQKLRASGAKPLDVPGSPEPVEQLKQIQRIKTSYESLTQLEPGFPPPQSPLPALLALRDTQQTIAATRTAIEVQKRKLREASKRLEKENSDLRDSRLINEALERRIELLKSQNLESEQDSPQQRAEKMVLEQQKLSTDIEKEIGLLTKALDRFIDNDLAILLAAEELGGPVTGDSLDINDEVLKSLQRGPRRSKRNSVSEDKDWRAEAGREIRALLLKLLEGPADGGQTSSYITLDGDSVAARFLIRAKVAQFHPRDPRRIRLVDFGREFDG